MTVDQIRLYLMLAIIIKIKTMRTFAKTMSGCVVFVDTLTNNDMWLHVVLQPLHYLQPSSVQKKQDCLQKYCLLNLQILPMKIQT